MDLQLKEQIKGFIYDIIGACHTVHSEMGPFLNEYMYQEALELEFAEKGIDAVKEYYFTTAYKGKPLRHKHYVDFLCKKKVIVECKAVEKIGDTQRQQLWNYMRLSNIRIGILFNFAPIRSQAERYYYNPETKIINAF